MKLFSIATHTALWTEKNSSAFGYTTCNARGQWGGHVARLRTKKLLENAHIEDVKDVWVDDTKVRLCELGMAGG
jgi:hypothetical protein